MSGRHARPQKQTPPWGKLAACTGSTAVLALGMAQVGMPGKAIALTIATPAAAVGCAWSALQIRQGQR